MKLLDQFVVKTLPWVPKPLVARLSKPYIAGENIEAAIACVKDLNSKGFKATIDILGEFVTHFDQALESFQGYQDTLKAIKEHGLDANISLKPTSFGLLLDRHRCESMITQLAEQAAAHANFLRLDMEDSPCTTMTIEIFDRLRKSFPSHVGVVLQAYMRRTMDDIHQITTTGVSHFRICKGIYVEPPHVAYQDYQEIRENYLRALVAMVDAGAFVGIATHDDYLVEKAEALIRERNLGPEHYEFQMLLGVREKLRDQLKAAGHNMRIYVPYGKDWYGYSVRRLKENPALAGTMFKAILLGD